MSFRKGKPRTTCAKNFGRTTVLLVEDTRLYSVAIRRELESRYGLDIVHCATYAEAKAALERSDTQYHLAILDLCQPDAADGQSLDLVVSHDIPVIVFSALSGEGRLRELSGKKICDLVLKNSIRAVDNLSAAVEKFLCSDRPTLLICDSSTGQNKLQKDLVDTGAFSIVRVNSLASALQALDSNRLIELMLLRAELITPEKISFISEIRNRFGEDSVRVIGYSRTTNGEDVTAFFAAGGDDFFNLPMGSAELRGRILNRLEAHRKVQGLRRMASRDYLTDLFNRRYFFDHGPKIVERCLRKGEPVCTALLDIDHFKRLNDTYGHEVGDLVLKAVSRRLNTLIGEKRHLLARLGGEEFGILFAGLDIQDSFDFCEFLRKELAKIRVAVDDEDISVTVSMGLATITGKETFDNYLNAADQYLYLAKHSGRNCVFSDYQVECINAEKAG